MRVYLDNCCPNRPYDDQAQLVVQREPFDYTEWRQDLFKDVPLEKLLQDAMDFRTGQRKGEPHV